MSLSANSVRIRIKDRRQSEVHTQHPQPLSVLPTPHPFAFWEPTSIFYTPPTRGVGFLPNLNLERSEWNYLSWHKQIMAPISLRFQI